MPPDLKKDILFKPRTVPIQRQFLNPDGTQQRNVPVFELDEIWEIPDEFDNEDVTAPQAMFKQEKATFKPPEENIEKYGFQRRNRNALSDYEDGPRPRTFYIFRD